MATTYSFKIDIAKRGSFNLSATDIIERFLEGGWSFYSEKKEIIYTDVGDKDDFDFLAIPKNKFDYYQIVNQKEKSSEIISLALFRIEENCRYRIDIMITPEFEIIITPDDLTRKKMDSDLDILDFNWYLCRVLPSLTNENMMVEGFMFSQR